MPPYISVKTYINLTGLSERTIRRYISMSTIDFISDSAKHKTLIALSEVKKNSPIPLASEDISLITKADKGDASAQNDLALLFLEHSKANSAIYWLTLSAKQDFSDAMQLLGCCYAEGNGIEKDANKAIMWISKAAALEHVLALEQMDAMLPS